MHNLTYVTHSFINIIVQWRKLLPKLVLYGRSIGTMYLLWQRNQCPGEGGGGITSSVGGKNDQKSGKYSCTYIQLLLLLCRRTNHTQTICCPRWITQLFIHFCPWHWWQWHLPMWAPDVNEIVVVRLYTVTNSTIFLHSWNPTRWHANENCHHVPHGTSHHFGYSGNSRNSVQLCLPTLQHHIQKQKVRLDGIDKICIYSVIHYC